MSLCIGYISALEFWRTANVDQSFLRPSSVACASIVLRDKPSADEVLALVRNFDFLSEPVHLLVAHASARFRSDRTVCHVSTAHFPKGSFVHVGAGVLVAEPELCFVQASTGASLAQLAKIGYELCGSYRLSDGETKGFCSGEPLASPASLRRFMGLAGSLRGVDDAQRALRYVIPNSASPMETVLVLLLCLPLRLGGYGLPLPSMNVRIEAEGRMGKVGSRSFYKCDLYWPDAKVAVEYDSDLFHTGSERIASDASRRNALAFRGVTVVTVTKRQVFHRAEFDGVVRLLMKLLGRRMRASSRDWSRERSNLRDELLGFH